MWIHSHHKDEMSERRHFIYLLNMHENHASAHKIHFVHAIIACGLWKCSLSIEQFLYSKLRSEMLFGDNDGFLCVYVGRISREKQINVIIDAVKDLPGIYLAIVGKC